MVRIGTPPPFPPTSRPLAPGLSLRSLGGAGARRDRRLDLALGGKASCLLLREDELAVQLDVEDAAAALDQRGAGPEPLLQLVRQTGGAGQIVSSHAILDGDVFGHRRLLPCLSLCLIHNANVYDWQCVNIFEWR
jgi:hypothetical protein